MNTGCRPEGYNHSHVGRFHRSPGSIVGQHTAPSGPSGPNVTMSHQIAEVGGPNPSLGTQLFAFLFLSVMCEHGLLTTDRRDGSADGDVSEAGYECLGRDHGYHGIRSEDGRCGIRAVKYSDRGRYHEVGRLLLKSQSSKAQSLSNY